MFATINKTSHKNIKIELTADDKLLVDTSKERSFLIDSSKSKHRFNTYAKYIKRITKLYYGVIYNQPDMRKLIERELLKELDIDEEFIRKYNSLKVQCQQRGHCIDTSFLITLKLA